MQGTRPFLLAFLLISSMGLPISCLAQDSTDKPLTNADVIKMVKAGIPESIILREIQMSRSELGTSAAALIDLKKHGASERILGAVLDSRSGTSNFISETPAYSYTPGQSEPSGSFRMPSFDADLRLNSSKREKISVGQNHINVVQSGVPVFSLKWKENDHPK